jgi:hypothetical protein
VHVIAKRKEPFTIQCSQNQKRFVLLLADLRDALKPENEYRSTDINMARIRNIMPAIFDAVIIPCLLTDYIDILLYQAANLNGFIRNQ